MFAELFFSDEERAGLFERKNFRQNRKDVHVKKLSLLSEQMEKCPNLPQNPFVEYAKYDGNVRTIYLRSLYKYFKMPFLVFIHMMFVLFWAFI